MLVVLVRVSVRWRVYLVMGYSVLGHVVAACGGQRRYTHKKHPMSPICGVVRCVLLLCGKWLVEGHNNIAVSPNTPRFRRVLAT